MLGPSPRLGALETMTFAAACTSRLRIGCSVFVSPLHQPVQLAKSIATLDQLSRGRIEIGFGTGGHGRPFGAFGIGPDHLVTRFTEGLAVMKACWTQPEATVKGQFWQLDRAAMEPKPFQKPYPPVWIGGSVPAAVRRAARIGDGFFGAGSTTTARFAEQVQVLRAALAERGTDPASFPVAKRVYIAVDEDAGRARDRMAAALIDVYGEAFGSRLLPVAVLGPPGGLRGRAARGRGRGRRADPAHRAVRRGRAAGAVRRRDRAGADLTAPPRRGRDETTIMTNAGVLRQKTTNGCRRNMPVLARMISPLPLQKSNKPLGGGAAVRRGRYRPARKHQLIRRRPALLRCMNDA